MVVNMDTTEGKMEIDTDKMELYAQRGDLCYPMVQLNERQWLASCPLTNRQYLVTNGDVAWAISHYKVGPAIGSKKHAGQVASK